MLCVRTCVPSSLTSFFFFFFFENGVDISIQLLHGLGELHDVLRAREVEPPRARNHHKHLSQLVQVPHLQLSHQVLLLADRPSKPNMLHHELEVSTPDLRCAAGEAVAVNLVLESIEGL